MSRRAGGHRATAAAHAAPIFTALGDPTRLRLVSRLCDEGPLSTAQLTSDTSLTRQAVTKHLQVLEDAGLAASERHGRERQWRIDAARMAETRRHLDAIAAQWDAAIGRLARHLASTP